MGASTLFIVIKGASYLNSIMNTDQECTVVFASEVLRKLRTLMSLRAACWTHWSCPCRIRVCHSPLHWCKTFFDVNCCFNLFQAMRHPCIQFKFPFVIRRVFDCQGNAISLEVLPTGPVATNGPMYYQVANDIRNSCPPWLYVDRFPTWMFHQQ